MTLLQQRYPTLPLQSTPQLKAVWLILWINELTIILSWRVKILQLMKQRVLNEPLFLNFLCQRAPCSSVGRISKTIRPHSSAFSTTHSRSTGTQQRLLARFRILRSHHSTRAPNRSATPSATVLQLTALIDKIKTSHMTAWASHNTTRYCMWRDWKLDILEESCTSIYLYCTLYSFL